MKFRMLKAGQIVPEIVQTRVDGYGWLWGSINVGKPLPADQVGRYRVPVGKRTLTITERLQGCLRLVKNGMTSRQIWEVRGTIADAIEILSTTEGKP